MKNDPFTFRNFVSAFVGRGAYFGNPPLRGISISSLASAIARFFRADPAETPPSPPAGNVAGLTRQLTPLDDRIWKMEEPEYVRRAKMNSEITLDRPAPKIPNVAGSPETVSHTEMVEQARQAHFGKRKPGGFGPVGEGPRHTAPTVPVFDDGPRAPLRHTDTCQCQRCHDYREAFAEHDRLTRAQARQERARATGRWPF